MRYEELLEHVTKNKMLVTCCIDAHFTAFQARRPNANHKANSNADPNLNP